MSSVGNQLLSQICRKRFGYTVQNWHNNRHGLQNQPTTYLQTRNKLYSIQMINIKRVNRHLLLESHKTWAISGNSSFSGMAPV